MIPFLPKKRNRSDSRALSLVELSFTVAIFGGIAIAIMVLYITVLGLEKTNRQMVQMSHDAANLHRELRTVASSGGVIQASADGLRVNFTRTDESGNVFNAALIYNNGDGDDSTIEDNRIIFDPNVDDGADSNQIVVRLVSPMRDGSGNPLPVFSRAGTFAEPLIVEFRMGDRTGDITGREARLNDDAASSEDAITGKGFQSLVFRGAYGPRNR